MMAIFLLSNFEKFNVHTGFSVIAKSNIMFTSTYIDELDIQESYKLMTFLLFTCIHTREQTLTKYK